MAKVPFSDEIVCLVLDKLKDPDFIQSLVDELRKLFKVYYMDRGWHSMVEHCVCISFTD